MSCEYSDGRYRHDRSGTASAPRRGADDRRYNDLEDTFHGDAPQRSDRSDARFARKALREKINTLGESSSIRTNPQWAR
jgi:hypothetical protein